MKFNFFSKKGGTLVVMFLFLLFSLSLVEAQPPFQQLESTNGLFIEVASPMEVILNRPFEFHIHVFNESNGVPLNSGLSCYLHLYNISGNHIFQGEDTTVSGLFDYEFDIPISNLSQVGEVVFVAQCNNTDGLGGVFSDEIIVTPTGFANLQWFYIIILILSLGIIILGFAKDDAPLVILGSFGLYFIALYILFFGIVGMKDPVYTWGIGLIILFVAIYVSIRSSYELIVN